MASTSSNIRVIFDGDSSGLTRAAAAARAAVSGFAGVAKGMAGLAAGGAAVQAVVGVAAALQQLAPAALLLPAALLSAGAAFATLKLGMQGVGDAIKSGDISKLAPQAGEAVTAIRSLKDAFGEIQQSVQGALFSGFGEQIRALGSAYLPILSEGLTAIAGKFNTMGLAAAKALQAPAAQNDVREVLRGTTELLGNMPNVIGNVLSGLLGIGGVGAQYMGRLGTSIENVTTKFKTWVDSSVESGRINELIDGAIQGFKDLAGIVGNVGSIIGSIFTGLSTGSGQSFLANIRDTTAAVADFMKSVAAQEPLQALGQTMAAAGIAIRGILLAALQALGPLITALAPGVQALAAAFGGAVIGALTALGPPLAQVAGALASGLAPILPVIGQLFVGLAQAIAPIIAALAPVIAAITSALLPAFQQLTPVISAIAMQLGQLLAQAIQTLTPIIAPLIDAILAIVAAVLPLIPPVLEVASSLLPLLGTVISSVVVPALQLIANLVRNVVAPAIQFLIPIIQGILSVVVSVFSGIISFLAGAIGAVLGVLNGLAVLPSKFSEWFGQAKDWATRKFDELVAWVRGVPDKILTALGDLGNLLVNVGRDMVNGLWNGIKAGWDWLVGQVKNLASSLLTAAKSALDIKSPSKAFADQVGAQIPAGVAQGIKANTGVATDAVKGLGSALVDAAAPGMVKFGEVSQELWDQLINSGWTGKAGDGMEAIYRPGADTSGLVSGIPDLVEFGKVGEDVWNQLIDAGWKGTPGDGMEAIYKPKVDTSGLAKATDEMVKFGQVATDVWENLLSQGWMGDPTDGVEALYKPGTVGKRATGGNVMAGRSYLVGEKGPEIVSMGGNGYVTPNSALGGGDTYVTVKIGDQELRGLVQTEIRESNRSTRRTASAGAGRRY